MGIESLVSTVLRRIFVIFVKHKGLVGKWQPAPAAGLLGGRPPAGLSPPLRFIETCKSMEIESLVSTVLRWISLISIKRKGLVGKWQPAPAASLLGGRPPAGQPAIPIAPPSLTFY